MFYASLIFYLLLILSCSKATTNIYSVPIKSEGQIYRKIAIGAITQDFILSSVIEKGFSEHFTKKGIPSIQLTKFYMENKPENWDALLQILKSAGVDAILVLSLADTGEKKIYVPPVAGSFSYGFGSLSGSGDWKNLYLAGQFQQHGSSYYRGGFFVTRHWAKGQLALYDIGQKTTVWNAASYTITKGSDAKVEDMVKSAAEEAWSKLKADGFLK